MCCSEWQSLPLLPKHSLEGCSQTQMQLSCDTVTSPSLHKHTTEACCDSTQIKWDIWPAAVRFQTLPPPSSFLEKAKPARRLIGHGVSEIVVSNRIVWLAPAEKSLCRCAACFHKRARSAGVGYLIPWLFIWPRYLISLGRCGGVKDKHTSVSLSLPLFLPLLPLPFVWWETEGL